MYVFVWLNECHMNDSPVSNSMTLIPSLGLREELPEIEPIERMIRIRISSSHALIQSSALNVLFSSLLLSD